MNSRAPKRRFGERRPPTTVALGAVMGMISPCLAAAAKPLETGSPVSELAELIWGLLLVGGFVVAAIIWVAILRRTSRRQLETIRQREQALHEHYQDLFENAHDILFAHDLDGQLTVLNRAGEQILGYPRDEACRLKLTQLIAPDDRVAYAQAIERLEGSANRGHVEVAAAAKDGRRVVLRINLRRQSLAGRPAQILGIAWDITQRRLAEEALRESENKLRRSLEERIRIGRDLHDGIIQSIYAVGLGLGECRRLVRDHPAAANRLDQSIADLNAVIRDVRNFIGGLEPEALKEREFGEALQAIASSLRAGTPFEFGLAVDPIAVRRLTPSQAAQFLQVAREAMTNALRHGRARRLEVSLKNNGAQLELVVQDDGTGFDPAAVSGPGLGLKNIEGRAQEMNGTCEIQSAPDRGTQVKLAVPVPSTDVD